MLSVSLVFRPFPVLLRSVSTLLLERHAPHDHTASASLLCPGSCWRSAECSSRKNSGDRESVPRSSLIERAQKTMTVPRDRVRVMDRYPDERWRARKAVIRFISPARLVPDPADSIPEPADLLSSSRSPCTDSWPAVTRHRHRAQLRAERRKRGTATRRTATSRAPEAGSSHHPAPFGPPPHWPSTRRAAPPAAAPCSTGPRAGATTTTRAAAPRPTPWPTSSPTPTPWPGSRRRTCCTPAIRVSSAPSCYKRLNSSKCSGDGFHSHNCQVPLLLGRNYRKQGISVRGSKSMHASPAANCRRSRQSLRQILPFNLISLFHGQTCS